MDDCADSISAEAVIAVPINRPALDLARRVAGVHADLLADELRLVERIPPEAAVHASSTLLLLATEFADKCVVLVEHLNSACSPVTNRHNYTAVLSLYSTVLAYTKSVNAMSAFNKAIEDDTVAAALTRHGNVKKRIKLNNMEPAQATQLHSAQSFVTMHKLRTDSLRDVDDACNREIVHLKHLERVNCARVAPTVRALLWAMGRVLLVNDVTWDDDLYGQQPTETPVLDVLVTKLEAQKYRNIDTLYHSGYGVN
jgi:hypothetical protein